MSESEREDNPEAMESADEEESGAASRPSPPSGSPRAPIASASLPTPGPSQSGTGKTSDVWKHFKPLISEPKYALCNHCETETKVRKCEFI